MGEHPIKIDYLNNITKMDLILSDLIRDLILRMDFDLADESEREAHQSYFDQQTKYLVTKRQQALQQAFREEGLLLDGRHQCLREIGQSLQKCGDQWIIQQIIGQIPNTSMDQGLIQRYLQRKEEILANTPLDQMMMIHPSTLIQPQTQDRKKK